MLKQLTDETLSNLTRTLTLNWMKLELKKHLEKMTDF